MRASVDPTTLDLVAFVATTTDFVAFFVFSGSAALCLIKLRTESKQATTVSECCFR